MRYRIIITTEDRKILEAVWILLERKYEVIGLTMALMLW